MITRIQVKNFKSLADFSLPLGNFTCLIGLNGAGKTTVLQVLDFIGHLASGTPDFRGWRRTDLVTNGSQTKTINIQVDFLIDKNSFIWYGRYNIEKEKFAEEQIYQIFSSSTDADANKVTMASLLRLIDNRLVCNNQFPVRDISDYNYKGSVLSAFKFDDPILLAVQRELQSLKSLELLTPNILRRASQANDNLGIGGEGLSGFLSKMKECDAQDLIATLHDFYPDVEKFEIKRKKFGWKNLLIKEATLKNPVSAEHANDGYLRVLAMLSQKYSSADFLLFDEIENGINQELIEKLLDQLQNFNGKQVMVTTHSALVLNYLTDEAAKDSVIFLYKDKAGHTHAKKFFEIDGMAKKLEVLGPGEVMGDTNLIELSRQMAESVNAEQE